MDSKEFIENAKNFDEVYKKSRIKIPRCDPKTMSDKEINYINNKQAVDWKTYEVKLI